MKFGPISITWLSKKESSRANNWLIDESPEGYEEDYLFRNPDLLTSSKDTRDLLENMDYHGDIASKKSFKCFAYCVGGVWAALLVYVVFGQGYAGGFQLEKEEFIAIVSTTTASVFGFAYIVGRYLFGSKAYQSKTTVSESVQSENNA